MQSTEDSKLQHVCWLYSMLEETKKHQNECIHDPQYAEDNSK